MSWTGVSASPAAQPSRSTAVRLAPPRDSVIATQACARVARSACLRFLGCPLVVPLGRQKDEILDRRRRNFFYSHVAFSA